MSKQLNMDFETVTQSRRRKPPRSKTTKILANQGDQAIKNHSSHTQQTVTAKSRSEKIEIIHKFPNQRHRPLPSA